MVEGLIISLVGMAAVFVSLTVIMFLMIGVERAFRSDNIGVVDGVGVVEGLGSIGVGIREDEQRAELAGGAASPESTAEVAAIALALAFHLGERGKVLGTSLRLNDVDYHIEVGDMGGVAVDVSVDGDGYRGSVGEEGLPPACRSDGTRLLRAARPQRLEAWRSAYPPALGGYWRRGGWAGGTRSRR
jgi:hypothetical protein